MANNFAVEIKCTRGYVRYLRSMDTSKLNDRARGKFKYFQTVPVLAGSPVPTGALLVSQERANFLSLVLNQARLITKVVEVLPEVTPETSSTSSTLKNV